MSKSRKTTINNTSTDYYPSANNRRNSNFNSSNYSDKLNSKKYLGKNKNNHDNEEDDDNDVYDYDDYNNTMVIPTVEATIIPYNIDNSGTVLYYCKHCK